MAKNGRPPVNPMRNIIVYLCVEDARKLKRPKHPGLKPVQLSWDKAFAVAHEVLDREWRITLSAGGIRAAYRNGKKTINQVESFRIRGIKYTRKKSAKNP